MTQRILVTGASAGIGAATVLLAARAGQRIGLNYRSNDAAAEAVAAEARGLGAEVLLLKGDVGNEADVERIFAEMDQAFGGLDVLVNNAGILEGGTRLEEISTDRFRRVLETNVIGCFLCMRAAVKRMSARDGGSGGVIVNVSSVAARMGSPFEYVDYAASKGALDSMTVGLAKEQAEQGVRVVGIRPGIVDTEIHAKGGEPDRIERVKSAVPMHRAGRPEEVAEAILWAASDKASYVTGTFIDVSGGR
ncbi:MAG: SDR family oxidoreductase [Kiloniellales bacterium]